MPDVTVEMLRRTNDVAGTLVSWLINPDGTEPVADAVARDRLEAIRVLLAGTLKTSLDAPTLAALETISVANMIPAVETGLAKELTLAAVLGAVDGLEAKDYATQTTLAAVLAATDGVEGLLGLIRDEQMRRTDAVVLGTSERFIGYVADFESRAVESGRYRWAGGKATTSVTAPNASCTLTNPAFMPDGVTPNDKDIILTRYQVEVDAGADVVLIEDATSSGTLMSQLNPNRRTSISNNASVRVGAGVLSGGTISSVTRRAQMNSPVAVGPFEWKLKPGTSWTVRFLGPGATNNVWFNIGFFAIDAGGRLV